MNQRYRKRNTAAFTGASYFALGAGLFLFCLGVYNDTWELNVKGYYLLCMVLITISCIVVQKVVRDNTEDKEFRLDNPKHRGLHNYGFCGFDYRVCDVFYWPLQCSI
ncbi:YiaA/YiaB family inner membrane protein [Paenibacillus sp. FSL R10-2791]|uniref:YiaA/YiaB family inner membrane protein n=1 Tax=Paenibacillus sp. FSL R10-2791 TaxID=2954695 RepID=UPI0030F78AAA